MSDHRVELDRGWTAWRLAALRSAGMPVESLAVFLPDERPDERPDDGDRAARVAAMERIHRAAFDSLLADEVFLGALTWQNPEAVDTWAGAHAAALRAGDRPRASRFGHRLAVLARYAQRYSAKNDTIGFFGPVAWARFGGDRTAWTGGGGIRSASAYVEVWAAQAIAAAWDAEPELRPHLPVRLDPSCVRRGDCVVRPYRRPLPLTPADRAVLDRIDAGAARLAEVVAEEPAFPTAELDSAVERLRAERVLQAGFRVPISSHPLDDLAAQMAGLPDGDTGRERAARIDRARRACREVAAADPSSRRAAIAAAGAELDAAAGVGVRRGPGPAVGGRTPVYLDCRRDLDATVSDALVDELARPLGILLDSAQWLCGQVADAVEEALLLRHRRLAATRTEVTLSDLYMSAADLFDPAAPGFTEVVADFRMRWQEILDGDTDAGGPVEIDVDVARRLADSLFPRASRTWAAARMHSPDLMLRRHDDGRLSWVLGEMHVALNTLESRFFSTQADDAGELVDAMAADMAPGRVVPLFPGTARDVSSRSYPPLSLDPPDHYRYVSFGSDDGHPTGVGSSPATAVVVTERNGELVGTCALHGWAAPVLECFGEQLSSVAVNLFSLRAPAAHQPRVALGALTVCRETWRMPLATVTDVPGRAKDPMQDELRARLAACGVPRHVFARVPGDTKPFYVDLAAPMLADNLARAARRAALTATVDPELALVEMLPAPGELWLRLDEGGYTSELRIVAVDPEPAEPASWTVG